MDGQRCHTATVPGMSESFVDATRTAYDVLAVEHTAVVRWDPTLQSQPFDRALLAAFAEWVNGSGLPRVADVGCGTGRISRILADLELEVLGIDLSPQMIAVARRTYPGLDFQVGSMLALKIADASLGGVLAYYSIIHVPWVRRADVFAEFRRVLAPGGWLMLAFQVGDERSRRDEVNGVPIPPLDFYRQRPEEVADLLTQAGFEVQVQAVRRPEPGSTPLPQAYVLASVPA
jgi:SAM-dependent methyltransferase